MLTVCLAYTLLRESCILIGDFTRCLLSLAYFSTTRLLEIQYSDWLIY